MSTAPYHRNESSIPVTVLAGMVPSPMPYAPDVALIKLGPATHDHDGAECLVCSMRGNVRALLFDLQEQVRLGLIPAFSSVTIDATGLEDISAIIADLTPGASPAFGMRDHAVARNFHLSEVIGSVEVKPIKHHEGIS